MRKTLLFLALSVLLLNTVSASYIAGDIYIYDNGAVRFNVESDIPLELEGVSFDNEIMRGTTDMLTSKSGGIWTFELNFEEYDTILLDVHLPKNLDTITSINGVDSAIDIENKIISLIDSGDLTFSASYKLKDTTSYGWIFWPLVLILIIIIFLVFKQSRKRKEHLDHVFPLINDNEQKIIELLMKKPIRQKEIRKILGFPKASFSRYLVNLEKKKLILREGEGKNKVVRLK